MQRALWKSTLFAVAVLLGAAQSQAAQLFFNGAVVAPLADAGTAFKLTLAYTAGASFATVDTATLIIGNQTWGTLVGSTNQISIDATRTQFIIVANFAQSTPGNLGSTVASLTFTVTGKNAASGQNASEANIDSLFYNQQSASGTFLTIPFSPPFSGAFLTLAGDLNSAPEPASVGLLVVLGAAVGVRCYRRRKSGTIAIEHQPA